MLLDFSKLILLFSFSIYFSFSFSFSLIFLLFASEYSDLLLLSDSSFSFILLNSIFPTISFPNFNSLLISITSLIIISLCFKCFINSSMFISSFSSLYSQLLINPFISSFLIMKSSKVFTKSSFLINLFMLFLSNSLYKSSTVFFVIDNL